MTLFAPQSIAVVGASIREGNLALNALRGLQKHGFAGRLVAVNPRYEQIEGVPCFPSLMDVDGSVEMVLVFVPASSVADTVRDAGNNGSETAIVFSSGFSETDDAGRHLQAELKKVASDAGVRVLGPNCQGLASFHSKVVATFSPAVLEMSGFAPSDVGYVGQSGAVGGSFFDLLRATGTVPCAWVSTGNEMDLTSVEVAEMMIEARNVSLICMYQEQVPDGQAWERLTRRAKIAGVRLAVLRSGRSEAGKRAAQSHTGALVRSDAAFGLLNQEQSVLVVDDVDELVAVAAAWRGRIAQGGRQIGIVTSSGGAGTLTADWIDRFELSVAGLQTSTQEKLSALVPSFGSVLNPVDVTAQLMTDNPSDFVSVCELLCSDPNIDQLVVVLTMFTGERAERLADRLSEFAATSDVPLSIIYLATPGATSGARKVYARAGVPVFDSIRLAVLAIARLAEPEMMANIEPSFEGAEWSPIGFEVPSGRDLTESDGMTVLDALGIGRPRGQLARTSSEAIDVARSLRGPLVLKVQSPSLLHKSDVGGVRLPVGVEDVETAFEEIVAAVRAARPDIDPEGVLVQEMAGEGVELLIGVQGARNGYAPVVTVGLGGTMAELLEDLVSASAPTTALRAVGMLERLRGYPLLAGYRGGPTYDVGAAAEAIAALGRFALGMGASLEEVEINPLIVHKKGATAADFLLRSRSTDSE